MKRVIPGSLLTGASLQALAHEGHGTDASSVMHYFGWPHILLPICAGLLVATGSYLVLRYRRQRLAVYRQRDERPANRPR